jgi:hypothetical protein
MGGGRSKKRRSRRRQRAVEQPPARRRALLAKGRAWWAWVLATAGAIATVAQLATTTMSRFTVSPLDVERPHKALNIPFLVRNDGWFPVENVYLDCLISSAQFARSGTRLGVKFRDVNSHVMHPIPSVLIDETAPTDCSFGIEATRIADLEEADISVLVRYQLWKWPQQFNKRFRFVAIRDESNTLKWVPMPASN